jgi:transcriptional regulator with XRE-family HTH domain
MARKKRNEKRIMARRDPKDQRVEIAKLLRKYSHPIYIRRQALGWGLEELGKVSDVDHAAISRFENGHRTPTLNALRHLAHAFNISTPQLVHEVEAWEEAEITPDNAERMLLDSFWAYTYEAPNLQKDWEGGLCEPPQEIEGAE